MYLPFEVRLRGGAFLDPNVAEPPEVSLRMDHRLTVTPELSCPGEIKNLLSPVIHDQVPSDPHVKLLPQASRSSGTRRQTL